MNLFDIPYQEEQEVYILSGSFLSLSIGKVYSFTRDDFISYLL